MREFDYNSGYHDAQTAFARSLTRRWNKGEHFNADYETGYWDGLTDAESGKAYVNPHRERPAD
jgi:hypothetical protein